MGKDEYKRKILEIHKRELYFDGQICPEAKFSDIDKKKVKEFLRKASDRRKLDIDETLLMKEILRKLKLMKGQDLTNACILLFSQNPQDFFIQAEIKCIRFKGTDITADMLDFKDVEGDLFQQVEEAENFVFRNIGLRAWLEDRKIERQEKWEYPPKAIREALVNAIVHRDYHSTGKVQVREGHWGQALTWDIIPATIISSNPYAAINALLREMSSLSKFFSSMASL